jgi:carboxypeptidase family protein
MKLFICPKHQRLQLSWIARCIAAALLIAMCSGSAMSQESGAASIAGQVLDDQDAAIVAARATLTDVSGHETSQTTDQEGRFVFSNVPQGSYTLRISAEHFRMYENQRIEVASANNVLNLTVTMHIAGVEESIAVFPDTSVAQVAEYIGGSLVIRGDALAALDAPGGLEALLRALAVRSSGPFGPSVLVNGFEDGTLPPTYSIREIRINDNPYSAEYSTPGLGRIEILTKPGTENLHAGMFGAFGDTNWNSRNPFVLGRVPYQSRMYGGNMSGPIWPRRAAFFLDFNRQQIDTNAVINATVVDRTFGIVPLRQAVVTPQLRTMFSPRLDLQMNSSNTLVLRYGEARSRSSNSGVGEFSLLSRAQGLKSLGQTFQLTETAVLNSKMINETRAQYVRTKNWTSGSSSLPTINVPAAFIGGGAEIGGAYNRQDLAELQSVISVQSEKHAMKGGLQGRYTTERDDSTPNSGGTYTFSSRVAPQLNSANQVVMDANDMPVLVPITTIEAYRRTLLFRDQNLSPEEVRKLGGGASQFSITTGDAKIRVWQYQAGAFLQDNWRLYPSFTLNAGIRYERQSTVFHKQDFAPRLAFAWGIGGSRTSNPTTVRAGVGIFYDRIAENAVLRARKMNGLYQREYFVSDDAILDLFPAIPSQADLTRFAVPQSMVQLAGNLRAPYTVNSSLAVERQLFGGLTMAITASNIRGVHLLRSRNINAPLPGTYDPAAPQRAVRPLATSSDIFQYESSGVFDQRQLLFNLVYRAGKNVTLWSAYTLTNSKTDTESADSFPANSYDMRSEYGRSVTPRHSLYWGGWIRMKGGFDITPLVLWRSDVPFDITTGRDSNGDSLFNDRPAFATDKSRPSVVTTRFGTFDLSPLPGQQIIPRNFGTSPNFFIANLRVGRRIPLTKKTAITLSIQGTNIFNHTNPGSPVGNLGSPLFGTSTVSAGDWGFGSNQAGNRRLEGMIYFNF